MSVTLNRPSSWPHQDSSPNRGPGPGGNVPPHAAAASGDLATLGRHLEAGGASARCPDGFTPLHHAATHGRTEAVELLLGAGAQVNERSGHGCDGTTALHCAVAGGHLAVVHGLLRRGASIRATDEAGYTPLLLAAELGHLAVVKVLLAEGADPHAEIGDMGALGLARRHRHAQVAALLRQVGVR